jgi:tRNA(Ile)-lysidine synthase
MIKYKLDINTSNNLLAFSAGIDSTALFFLMLEQNIPFDIAIVDYHQRIQSKDEVIYATQLAHKYKKKCFISSFPNSTKFSEKTARDYRYNFFKEIINQNGYHSLITAHQLNDKLEWFLMQLTKGAGLPEIIGMQTYSIFDDYQVIKPLLYFSKKELQEYLDNSNKKYFIDISNYNEKYKRNYFRHNFSDKLLKEFQKGISQSFHYLEEDNNSLLKDIKETKIKDLSIYEFNNDSNIAIRIIDKELKSRGIIISQATREEIKKNKEVVVSHKISVAIVKNKIYIAPNITRKMDKKFKEKCRISKIPKNTRAYIFTLEQEKVFIL